MPKILEADGNGDVVLSRDVLGSARPHARYRVDTDGGLVVLHLVEEDGPFWSVASTEQWLESFHAWMNLPRPSSPDLPGEAFSRESIYDR